MKFLVQRDSEKVINRWYIFDTTADRWKTKFYYDTYTKQWKKKSGSNVSLPYQDMVAPRIKHINGCEVKYDRYSPEYTDDEFTNFLTRNFIDVI